MSDQTKQPEPGDHEKIAKRWEREAHKLDALGYVETAAALCAAAKRHRAKGLFGTPQDDMTERMKADD